MQTQQLRRKRWLVLDRQCEGCLRRTSQQRGERRAEEEKDFDDEWQWHLIKNRSRINALSLVDLECTGAPCSTPDQCGYACLVCGLNIRCSAERTWGTLWSFFGKESDELDSHRRAMALLRFAAESGALVLKRWRRAVHSRSTHFFLRDPCTPDEPAGALRGYPAAAWHPPVFSAASTTSLAAPHHRERGCRRSTATPTARTLRRCRLRGTLNTLHRYQRSLPKTQHSGGTCSSA